ncbi:MAG: type II toxin-antitoxin system RelE/ParE family toxin [Bacteroidota bacterium]|nr:type II toxin-antitoxin system RelE/ParE family toxin [Bacteroidota bacterium]
MIRSFHCKESRKVFHGVTSKKLPETILRPARRKLRMLHAAATLKDISSPPSNHLEKLVGKRAGQYSIRINSQWRICFFWRNGNACEVEIVDYHKG